VKSKRKVLEGFLASASRHPPTPPPPPQKAVIAGAIPPPHIPFAPSSNSLLDVPRPGAPRPFSSFPCLLHLASSCPFCFGVLMYYFMSVLVFFGFFFFFFFFLQFLPIFSTPVLLPSVHCWAFFAPPPRRASTVLFFVWGQRTRNRFLSLYFFLLVFNSTVFLFHVFHLLFACNNALASMVQLDSL
jgi:hypothetical protein